MASRVNATAIIGGGDTFGLPRSTNRGVGSRHGKGLQDLQREGWKDQQSGPSEPGNKYTKIIAPAQQDL